MLLDEIHPREVLLEDYMNPLGMFFSMESRFWLNLQTEYDLRFAARELTPKLAPLIRVFRASAA